MQDLRLIGVHEDGLHLLLAGPDGERFSLPLDDALRAAARQDRPRLGQLQIEMDGGLRPRDVQAMIRAGASAEDVAARAGWSVDKVRRYEGPIIAERVHVADLAREVRLRARGSGGVAATLSARVTERMRDRGVDPDTSTWDAWRLPETEHWTVSLTFAAGGRQRQAAWSFDPTSRVVDAQDDEARWLSEEEPAAGPLPASQSGSGAGSRADVYDVEAEGGVMESRRPPRTRPPVEEPLDLMTAMRERSTVRGRRGTRRKAASTSPTALPSDPVLPSGDSVLVSGDLGSSGGGSSDDGSSADRSSDDRSSEERSSEDRSSEDEGRTDALPIAEISFDPVVDDLPPAAHTHPDDDPEVSGTGGDLEVTTDGRHAGSPDGGTRHTGRRGSTAAVDPDEAADASDGPDSADGAQHENDDQDDVAEARPAAPPPSAPARKGRPSVPSWDDIMFGSSRD